MRSSILRFCLLAVALTGCDSTAIPDESNESGSRSVETHISFSVLDGPQGYDTQGSFTCASSGQADLTRAQVFVDGRPGAALDTLLTGANWLHQFNMSVYGPTHLTLTCWASPTLSQTEEIGLAVNGRLEGQQYPTIDYAYGVVESGQVVGAQSVFLSFLGGPINSPIIPRPANGWGLLRPEDIPAYTRRVSVRAENSDLYFDRGFNTFWTNPESKSIHQIFYPKELCLENMPPEYRTLDSCIQATNELLFWSEVEYTELVGYRTRYDKGKVLLITRFHESGNPVDSDWITMVYDAVSALNEQGMELHIDEHAQAPPSSLARHSWGMYMAWNGEDTLVLPVDGQSEEWLTNLYDFHPPFYRINGSSFQIGSTALLNRDEAYVGLLKVILGANESPLLDSFPVEYQIKFLTSWISQLRKNDQDVWGIERGEQVENVLGVN